MINEYEKCCFIGNQKERFSCTGSTKGVSRSNHSSSTKEDINMLICLYVFTNSMTLTDVNVVGFWPNFCCQNNMLALYKLSWWPLFYDHLFFGYNFVA